MMAMVAVMEVFSSRVSIVRIWMGQHRSMKKGMGMEMKIIQ